MGEAYRTIAFPFAERAAPAFVMERAVTLAELAGYVGTWSASARLARATGRAAESELLDVLGPRWGDPARRTLVRWPLAVRAGHRTELT